MKTAAKLLTLTLALTAPTVALAGYTVNGPVSQTFTPIAGTVLNTYYSGPTDVLVSLPFSFRFWGTTYTQVKVGYRGYLNFAGDAQTGTPYGIPSTNKPNPLAAAWWGNWYADAGSVTWATSGTAPNRVVVFQWSNVYYAYDSKKSVNGATFQARLYEGSNKLEFDYGTNGMSRYTSPNSVNAAVGVQNETGTKGVTGLPCTTNTSAVCKPADFTENTAVTFQQPPDLTLARVYADEVGYAGVPMRMGAAIVNQGGDDARAVQVRFYLSTQTTLDTTKATVLDNTRAIDVAYGQRRDVVISPALPKTLAAGTYYLHAVVDADKLINEDDETNNLAPVAGLAFQLGQPTPDLAVTSVTAPQSAAPGASVKVSRTLQNVGNSIVGACGGAVVCGAGNTCDAGRCRPTCAQTADCRAPLACDSVKLVCDAPAGCAVDGDCFSNERCSAGACQPKAIRYALYISDNPVISVADRLLTPQPGYVELPAGITAFDVDVADDTVTLPSDLTPGDYYLGVIVDPGNTLAEISEVNNSGAASVPVTISSGSVSLTTKTLPDGTALAPYGYSLRAAGGDGSYSFTIANGALPPGVELASAGRLSGTPLKAGSFDVTVQVQSGTSTATGTLTVKVNPSAIPLTVVTADLPAAEFNKPYAVKLSAVGGKAPYVWSLSSGANLPPGMALAADGTLEGAPQLDGNFALQVEVKDDAGTVRAQPLSLLVAAPDRMRVVTSRLPDGWLGKAYSAALSAVGGRAPYSWKIVDTRLLAVDPTDIASPGSTNPPEGLALVVDKGFASFSGSPARAGTYGITLQATDATGKSDTATVLLTVRYDNGIQIVTQGLPDAIVGKPYETSLAASGGEGSLTWSITCVPSYSDTGEVQPCKQGLPPGFSLVDGGVITTQDNTVAVAADEAGNTPERTPYSFLVKVQDARGRSAVAALSITLRVDTAPEVTRPPSTCATGVGAPLPMGLALLLGGLLLRRRRAQ